MSKIKIESKTKKFIEKTILNNRQGFMMVEAVFSIFIVGVILVTFMSVMAGVFRTEFAKRDLIIASNLAQEGVEILRQRRDNNWKYGCKAFGNFDYSSGAQLTDNCDPFTGNTAHGKGQQFPANFTGNIDYDESAVTSSGELLYLNSDGFYQRTPTSTPSKFSRQIRVSSSSADQRTIESIVSWAGKTVTITDALYAWGDPE